MPLGTGYPDQNCPIAGSLEVLGERWTFLIVRDAFYGRTRYDEFQKSLGVATNVLSGRLQKLLEAGIFEQPDGPRGGYRLTAKGRDLLPVLLALMQWGNDYGLGPAQASVDVRHECGADLDALHSCRACGEPIAIDSLRITPAAEAV